MGIPFDHLPPHVQQQIREQKQEEVNLHIRMGRDTKDLNTRGMTAQITAKARPKQNKNEAGMNGLEQRYAAHLDQLKALGDIVHWQFQPWTLNYAPGATYKFDFLVIVADGSLEVHETKGHWEPAARVKVKACAKEFWYLTFYGVTEDEDGIFKYEQFHPNKPPTKLYP